MICRIRRPLKCTKIHSVLLPILLLPLTPIVCHLKTIPKKKISKEDLYSVLLFPLCIETNVSIMLAVLVVVCCLVTKSFLRLCDPMDCSSPVSSVHGFPFLVCVAFLYLGDLPDPGIILESEVKTTDENNYLNYMKTEALLYEFSHWNWQFWYWHFYPGKQKDYHIQWTESIISTLSYQNCTLTVLFNIL